MAELNSPKRIVVDFERDLDLPHINRLHILSGTAAEAKRFANDHHYHHQFHSFRYIANYRDLLGVRRPYFVRVGTWADRGDLELVEEELQICLADEVVEKDGYFRVAD